MSQDYHSQPDLQEDQNIPQVFPHDLEKFPYNIIHKLPSRREALI
jgi:hypothetical protein